MLVGAQLRRLREASGLTCQSAGAAIQASHSKISRLELGRRGFKQRDVEDLLTLYGVDGGAERATLLELAELATAPPWWREYADVVPRWFEDYLGLEQAASVIRSYEVQFVPGLLQTPEYARAVVRLAHREQPEAVIDRRVALRMKRQRLLLHRPNPPKLWAVIDEAALRRPIGGADTMRAQLRHLLEVAELPNVTVEVMPFSAGGHAAAGGPITLLRFPEDDIPDVVYLEQLTNAVYATKTTDVDYYWHVLNRVVIEAEPPNASVKILQRILRET
ncbi:helix-turn-helix domain-containing protein [Actinoallomurus sp. WRP6H-15]|nr:helix-turn-helix transcriptional regulator [Actinoallomurus soli]MCO5968883.1 helix-turn-helix domain-containing protein [Actinoallomurus soli]